MRRPLLAAVVVLAALGAACSDDDGSSVSADPTAPTTTSTSAAPTTTTATTIVQTPLPTGRNAIDAVLGAWQAGDRAAALLVAAPEAVAALFAIPPGPAEARGCNSANVQVDIQCVYRLGSGELQVRAAPTDDGTGFLVDFVFLGS